MHIINSNIAQLDFHELTVADKKTLQGITLTAGRRNCNFTFANLVGWRGWFSTEVCVWQETVVFRFTMERRKVYMLCSAHPATRQLLQLLCDDAREDGEGVQLVCLEDTQAAEIKSVWPGVVAITPQRDQYNYIYLRQDLAELKGKHLKAKRNHVNQFLSSHAGFRYYDLTPALFDKCRRLHERWRSEVQRDDIKYNLTADAEQRAMETMFKYWGELEMRGGCIMVGEELVAFTCGAPVTDDTFDVCIEKADRAVDGAFNIINQQFAAHLPEQYRYINREEDMGLEGLRKSKLSYHPYELLTFNRVELTCV